jgi:hypothetical protein
MSLLSGGHQGPEGKNICLNTALRRTVVLMSILSGGASGSQRRLDVWMRQVGISAYVG